MEEQKGSGLVRSNLTKGLKRSQETSGSLCPQSGQRISHNSPLIPYHEPCKHVPASFPHMSRGWQLAGWGGRKGVWIWGRGFLGRGGAEENEGLPITFPKREADSSGWSPWLHSQGWASPTRLGGLM